MTRLWIFLLTFTSCAFGGGLQAQTLTEQAREFRKAYPFHKQTLAVSMPADDGTRTLLVTEPPPGRTAEYLKALLGPAYVRHEECKHRIGVDGWVKDYAILLAKCDDSKLSELLACLHQDLFHSTFGQEVLSLPVKAPGPIVASLDVKVTVPELQKWLASDDIEFRSLAGGPARTHAKLISDGADGVFQNAEKGLVLWCLPKAVKVPDRRREARQFAVAMDIIFGAVADENCLTVVGRRRLVPTTQLPPLRVETVEMLSLVTHDELAQSYERNRIFAGRFNATTDWAPILLSPELENTDFGSLLNITDQMLKGWSMQNLVTYANFPYPTPGSFPFEKPITKVLSADRVQFNWNAQGSELVVRDDSRTWHGTTRTGSLPMSYLPGGASSDDAAKAEAVGWDYFATLSDPNLATVANYSTLFRIFRAHRPTTGDAPPPTVSSRAGHSVLQKHAQAGLRAMAKATDDDLNALAALVEKEDKAKITGLVNKLKEIREKQKKYQEREGDSDWSVLAHHFADPRGLHAPKQYARSQTASNYVRAAIEARDTEYYKLFISPDRVHRDYKASFVDPQDCNIRTPSVVNSRPKGTESFTGGHSLGTSKLTYQVGDVKPGTVRVRPTGKGLVIEYHQDDLGKLSALTRSTEQMLATRTRWTIGDLQKSMSEQLGKQPKAPPVRESLEALLGGGAESPKVGLTFGGGQPPRKPPTPPKFDEFSPDGTPRLKLSREGRYYQVALAFDGQVEVKLFDSQIAAIEHLRTAKAGWLGKEPLVLRVDGMTPAESEDFLASLRNFALTDAEPKQATWLRWKAPAVPVFKTHDFSKAQIVESTVTVEAGEGRWKDYSLVSFDVRIPAKVKKQKSYWLAFRAYIRNLGSNAKDNQEHAKAKATEAFEKIYNTSQSSEDIERMMAELRKDAKTYGLFQSELYADQDKLDVFEKGIIRNTPEREDRDDSHGLRLANRVASHGGGSHSGLATRTKSALRSHYAVGLQRSSERVRSVRG